MENVPLRSALAVSLALNLFALGAAGGAAVMWSNLKRHSVETRRPLRAAADGLALEDQARFRASLRETWRSVRPLQRAAQQNRWRAADLFVQPTFDPQAATAALAQARDADFALRTRLDGAVVGFASGLPQSKRLILARALARGGPLRHPQSQADAAAKP